MAISTHCNDEIFVMSPTKRVVIFENERLNFTTQQTDSITKR